MASLNSWAIVLLVFAALSFRDVVTNSDVRSHKTADDSAEDFAEFDDELPAAKYSQAANEETDEVEIRSPTGGHDGKPFTLPLNAPPVRFSYCISCGYRQAFDQYSQILNEKFPGVNIEGSNYPANPVKGGLAYVISFVKIALIASVMFNRNPFETFGVATPSFFTWMTGNKVSACMMVFLLSNTLESMLLSTGAFEVYVGDEIVWSKLESGRVPSPTELLQAVESQLQLQGAKISGGGDGFGFD